MTTDKHGHCVCGKVLTECRDVCCDATLRALSGEWVGTPWNYRYDYHEKPDPDSMFDSMFEDGDGGNFDPEDDGFGWDFGSWDPEPYTYWDAVKGFTPARLWEMMLAVGGVTKGIIEKYGWGATLRISGEQFWADTAADAVINAYAAQVDWRECDDD